jgi:SAM-dependent methyltransferase
MAPQTWNPEQYQTHAAFVPALGAPVLSLLAPRAGERVLDLGCGDGVLSVELVRAGCEVVGVDSSPEQVAAARARGLDARLMSGEELSFEDEFDAVFSNAALHWMKRKQRVIQGAQRALKPGGRFVAEFGGAGCVQNIRVALVQALERRGISGEAHVPWYFPTPFAYRTELEAGGFVVDSIVLIERPTPLPGDILAWLEMMAQTFAEPLPPAERARYFQEVRASLAASLQRPDGSWWADYVRLRFAAHRSAGARASER